MTATEDVIEPGSFCPTQDSFNEQSSLWDSSSAWLRLFQLQCSVRLFLFKLNFLFSPPLSVSNVQHSLKALLFTPASCALYFSQAFPQYLLACVILVWFLLWGGLRLILECFQEQVLGGIQERRRSEEVVVDELSDVTGNSEPGMTFQSRLKLRQEGHIVIPCIHESSDKGCYMRRT